MTVIEIALIVIGCIFMIASFFISEKLSGKEINRVAELSDNELKRIIQKGMEKASTQIETVVDQKVDEVSEKAERALERESNLKIMAIDEYSGTVIEEMKKTHDEIMFLYSMLNDKHTELTSLTGDLQRLAANVRNLQDGVQVKSESSRTVSNIDMTKPDIPASAIFTGMGVASNIEKEEQQMLYDLSSRDFYEDTESNNDRILALYKEGFNRIEIARKLGLGVGEVSLVIGLYKGER